jgi:hypothetical protein
MNKTLTNATVLLLSGYVVQWVVQQMFKDIAAVPLNIPKKRYCFVFLFCVLRNTNIVPGGGAVEEEAYLRCTSCTERNPILFNT